MAAAVMTEQVRIGARVPAKSLDPEGVARLGAGMRRWDRPHLLHQRRVEHGAAIEGAVVQLESEIAGEVGRAAVQAAGRHHRVKHGQVTRGHGRGMPHGAVPSSDDRGSVERAPIHAQRPEQQVVHDLWERALHTFVRG